MSLVLLVSGASRGLGRSIVRAAAEAGHRVLATARRPETLDDLVADHPDTVRAVALDVTDPAAAHAAVLAAVEHFGRLDVLVNNAGYANLGTVEDTPFEDVEAQIRTNLLGVIALTQAALPVMRGQGRGHVIQISSVGGRLATPGLAAYQAAKWAVGGFSEVLAHEVGPLGVRVTVLEPGGMRTDWAGSSMTHHRVGEAYSPLMAAMAALHEQVAATPVGDPDRVARVVLDVAAMDEPPLRLLLGSDTVDLVRSAAARRAQEDDRWHDLTLSTDADDAVAPDLSALAQATGGSAGATR